MKTNGNYGFFFGAGAEACYGLPLGAKFTRDTMLWKNSELYDALSDFYTENNSSKDPKYSKKFMFQKNSPTLNEMVREAVRNCKVDDKDDIMVKFKENVSEYDRMKDSGDNIGDSEKIKNQYEESFNTFYKKIVEERSEKEYIGLVNNLCYFGAVEKDFATIIDPKRAGGVKYYRLINYFWNAYFSILTPMLEKSDKYSKEEINRDEIYKGKKYKYFLTNLDDIIKYIYSNEFLQEYKKNIEDQCYYAEIIAAELTPKCVLTTNYTPFTKVFGIGDIFYLSGKLSQFEIPKELRIVDFEKGENVDMKTKHVFPYILTQAPIKPIINPTQIAEYSNAICALSELDVLVILGYSLCENDNHINAILRDFVIQENKKIIYCNYLSENAEKKEEEEVIKYVKERLFLNDTDTDKIKVILYGKDTKNIAELIKEKINNL